MTQNKKRPANNNAADNKNNNNKKMKAKRPKDEDEEEDFFNDDMLDDMLDDDVEGRTVDANQLSKLGVIVKEEEDNVEEDNEAKFEKSKLWNEKGIFFQNKNQENWKRPAVAPIDVQKDSVVFQQLDADYYPGPALAGMPGLSKGNVPIVRLYGVNDAGNSVLCHVHGFVPYIYVQAPAQFQQKDCDATRAHLNKRLAANVKNADQSELVVGVELVFKRSIMYYCFGQNQKFLKIYTALPKFVPPLRKLIENGVDIPTYGFLNRLTFESDILFVVRCMIDTNIVGGNWIELPAGKYRLRTEDIKTSYCQIEVDVSYEDLISHPPEGEWSRIAPLRILSFDIECAGRKGVFPEPEHDPVIQIANYVSVLNNGKGGGATGASTTVVKNIFTLDSCANIVGAEVLSFKKEEVLLEHWRKFFIRVDADIITGYNIGNFDLPYLINRARKLKLSSFEFLGRIKTSKIVMRDSVFSSKAYGTRENKDITIDGRVQLDVIQAIRRDYKLASYSLNAVSAHFLNEQKEDVHHSIIADLQNTSPETRRRLAVYCLKDAYLPQRLLDKLMIIVNYTEMARVTGVPLSFLLTRGQQIKVVSQLLRKAKDENVLLPTQRIEATDEKYAGATVIEPKRGFYDKPIATLDFASLYPSIMMAHNLCYTTLLKKSDVQKLSPDQYERTPSGEYFVKSSVQKGLLPRILEELLSARKKAKADLQVATDPFEKMVLNGRQNALKVSANSVYGFTGAQVGRLPCLEISSSVTAYGREMIEATKAEVEDYYTVKNGYAHNAVVVYGDTDSVMVMFGTDDLGESMELGKHASVHITKKLFQPPIKLEFEKCYYPYLLINKKRYAGLLWTKTEKYDKLDTKGIETVRRDNCPLVKNVVTTVLHKILVDKNIIEAQNYVKKIISDLLMNQIDISMLVISKSLSKHAEDYDNKQPHVELAARMKKRDPGSAPNIGDRVAYVIIQGAKGSPAYERSEDPIYVLENNIPIDINYYLENQLKKPLQRIFEPIMDNFNSLLVGEHTRSISKPTPTVGGIMKFAKKTITCLGCKVALPSGNEHDNLCQHCKSKEAEIYQKLMDNVLHFENLFSRTWTQCQRCQGSFHQDVLCASRDCPIFYMRTKVQKDLRDAQAKLDRFAPHLPLLLLQKQHQHNNGKCEAGNATSGDHDALAQAAIDLEW